MSPDATLVEKVRAVLGRTRFVEKRMFGGTAFMVRGRLCIAAGPKRIMCRIGPERHDAAVARAGCRPVVMKGRVYRGYVHVDAHALSTMRSLRYWIGLALAYNRAAKASKKRKARRSA